jgi:hypothetical protein
VRRAEVGILLEEDAHRILVPVDDSRWARNERKGLEQVTRRRLLTAGASDPQTRLTAGDAVARGDRVVGVKGLREAGASVESRP